MLAGPFSEGAVSVFHILLTPPGAWLVMAGVLGGGEERYLYSNMPCDGGGEQCLAEKGYPAFQEPLDSRI